MQKNDRLLVYTESQNMIFEYDPNKNQENFRKHGVDFEEAISVF